MRPPPPPAEGLLWPLEGEGAVIDWPAPVPAAPALGDWPVDGRFPLGIIGECWESSSA